MKILLAVDGSRTSLAAVRYVADRLAMEARKGDLQVLHVCYRVPPHAAAAVDRNILNTYYRDLTEEVVAPVRQLLDSRSVPHRILRGTGYPPVEISRCAESGKFDLVVMGTHGMGAAKALLLGSTTQGVIAGCDVPLLLVKYGGNGGRGDVLVASDGSRHTRHAVSYLLRHRARLAADAGITLLHVSPQLPNNLPTAGRKVVTAAHDIGFERAMEGPRRLLTRARMDWREVRMTGEPGAQIAAHAQRNDCSLIIMGSHGRTTVSGLLLGSVVQKTIAAARTPVLIVR
jgi:nucleotide-binding universal stress UspA family protein